MKYLTRFFTIVLIAGVLMASKASWAGTAPSAKGEPLDSVVAIVNTEVITRSELNRAVAIAEKQLMASNVPLPPLHQLQLQVLNQLIDQKVELQTAARMNITVSEDQLNQAIAGIAAKNKMTTEQLQAALAEDHIDFPTYRKQIKDQMIIQQLLQRAVGSNITITAQDVKNAANTATTTAMQNNTYQVADILIALPDNPTPEQLQQAQQKAASIMSQLQNGANFNTLAAANSDGQEAMNGGDLGWRTLEELPSIFAAKITTMKTGSVAGPLRAANGIHIIKLVGVKSEEQQQHFITETNVRHILIKTNLPSDDAPARAELISIRKQIENGANFADMAKRYSQDTGSAIKGGDLGWVSPGMLVAPFEEAMNGLAINQISQPIKSQYGWHLIQVLGRKQVDDSQIYRQNQLKKMVYIKQFNENSTIWVQQLRDESYIKILI